MLATASSVGLAARWDRADKVGYAARVLGVGWDRAGKGLLDPVGNRGDGRIMRRGAVALGKGAGPACEALRRCVAPACRAVGVSPEQCRTRARRRVAEGGPAAD